MTERLYWIDPYQREFTARVVRQTPKGVVLDRTLFYPTSGGQPHDTGTLGSARVVDVVEEGEEIVHVLEGPAPAGEVKGAVDWDRRLDHMQQHDGQHILSEAFIRVAHADSTSFHLGRDTCSIELDKGTVSPADVEAAEQMANRVIWENRPISIGWFSREEASKLPLRKAPLVEGRIRIVHVKDFDCSPCCGTHARSSGEAGAVLVVGVERMKSKTTVSFVCGNRAIAYARQDVETLRTLGARVSASRDELVKTVERIQLEGAEVRKALAAAEKQLAEAKAREMAAAAVPRGRVRFVIHAFEGRDIKYLQTLAALVAAGPGLVVILGATGESSSVVLARSKDVEIDLRPIGKDAFALLEGRGGGPPQMVQGGGPGRNVGAAMALAEQKIAAALP